MAIFMLYEFVIYIFQSKHFHNRGSQSRCVLFRRKRYIFSNATSCVRHIASQNKRLWSVRERNDTDCTRLLVEWDRYIRSHSYRSQDIKATCHSPLSNIMLLSNKIFFFCQEFWEKEGEVSWCGPLSPQQGNADLRGAGQWATVAWGHHPIPGQGIRHEDRLVLP